MAFAEQQLMDCSWGYGLNHACDGGGSPETSSSVQVLVASLLQGCMQPYECCSTMLEC